MKTSGILQAVAFLAVVCSAVGEEACPASAAAAGCEKAQEKPRVIVSTDIGGYDPDDFQSMVHYLVYTDRFDTEGLIASPPGAGRAADILAAIDAYEKDYGNLSSHAAYPTPQSLREVTKQGAIDPSPEAGYSDATEGSNWIIARAKADDPRPLWIVVWGSVTDVAQALHDDPSIKGKIRVYYISSWNTLMDPHARNYVYNQHPDLWMIEANTTFRGMYVGGEQGGDLGNVSFVEQHVRHHGALGDFFYSKKRDIKMGDTPSVFYLLHGDPDDPTAESWGGRFRATDHGAHYWTDLTQEDYREGKEYYGAKTVNMHRQAFLRDWQTRMEWAKSPNPKACEPSSHEPKPVEIWAEGDLTTRNGVNFNAKPTDHGLLVKYEGDMSWIQFTLGATPANEAILTLFHADGAVRQPWEVVVRGAEFSFDEAMFTGTDFGAWTRIGVIPNVMADDTYHHLDMTAFYNAHLGKTITLHLYRDVQPEGNGPVFADREGTRRDATPAEGPRIIVR